MFKKRTTGLEGDTLKAQLLLSTWSVHFIPFSIGLSIALHFILLKTSLKYNNVGTQVDI